MAYRVLRACGVITNSVKNCHVVNNVSTINPLKSHIPMVQNARNTSFFNKKPAEHLWKSVTSVSNAGKRRGRAKGVTRRKDLNRGQALGMGKINIRFPGLNAPIFRGRELIQQTRLPEDPERQQKLLEMRNKLLGYKRVKLTPLERGWTGAKLGGRKIGPPDAIGDDTFEGFETWILQSRVVSTMTSNLGRKKSTYTFVVTGNGKGLAGFGVAKTPELKVSMRKAKNRAAQKLMYIPTYNDHTVLHDFFTQFGKSKIYVRQMHHGYGLRCHRAIKACCEAIGIKDMYAKVEGSNNLPHIIKAFFIGLLKQKTHQQLAEEKQLHVVELRKENDYFPTVVASPTTVRSEEEISTSELLDFKQYVMGGKLVLQKKKFPPFYTKHPSWLIHLRKEERWRDQKEVRRRLVAEYGELRSFLTEKYPECKPQVWRKKSAETDTE